MACRPSETGRLQKLGRPARVLCGVMGFLLIAGSFWVPGPRGPVLAAAGGLVVFVVVLLPALTDFELDLLGIRAKASLATRGQRVQAICQREHRQLSSFVEMVGIDPADVGPLVEEAVADTCRLWRGQIVDELIRQLLICRAVRLIRVSARLGVPYQFATSSDFGEYGTAGAAFASLGISQRLIVALVEHHEMDTEDVAAMLEVERREVAQALDRMANLSDVAGGWT